MKLKKYFLIILCFCSTIILSQQYRNVFIMIDRSGTIVPAESNNAKQVLKEVILGSNISNNDFYIEPGNSLRLDHPLLSSGARLYIIPFGNKLERNFSFPQTAVSNLSYDVANFIETNYPTTFNDGYTYLNLTAAQIAEYAKNNNINNYLLIIISDFRKDTGPNLSSNESKLMDSIAKKDTGAVNGLIASVNYKPHNIFGIKFYEWDLSNWRKHGSAPPITTTGPSIPVDCEITLLGLKGGKENKPITVENENLTISWTLNCSSAVNYAVLISGLEGNDFRERKIVTGSFYNTKLEDGKYRITVSANLGNDSNVIIKPATTYIEVSTGSSFFIWFLLILLVGGAGGYYIWKNKLFTRKKTNTEEPPIKDW